MAILKRHGPPLTYQDCLRLWLASAISSQGRLSSHAQVEIMDNTYLFRNGVRFVVLFYLATIIEVLPSGEFVLSAGGYRSVTTKARIRRLTGASLYSRDHVWYVGDQPFFDGMMLRADREPYALNYMILSDPDYLMFATMEELAAYLHAQSRQNERVYAYQPAGRNSRPLSASEQKQLDKLLDRLRRQGSTR